MIYIEWLQGYLTLSLTQTMHETQHKGIVGVVVQGPSGTASRLAVLVTDSLKLVVLFLVLFSKYFQDSLFPSTCT